MGYWKSSNGIIGDGPADVMAEAIEDIRACYREDLGREPTKIEICELLGFVLAAIDDLEYRHDPERQRN
jgi:hypothetical protein